MHLRSAALALVLILSSLAPAWAASGRCRGEILQAAGRFSKSARAASERERYIEAVRTCALDQTVALTRQLIRFRTVSSAPPEERDPQLAAMSKFLRGWATRHGFGFNVIGNNDVFEITWGSPPVRLGWVFHGDVVPAPRHEWKRDPFAPEVVNGRLFGRGAEDDKGPLAATLVSLAMAKAMGLSPSGQVRVIIGNGEESDWSPMASYAEKAPKMEYAISVDSNFPVVAAQSGFVAWTLSADAGAQSQETGRSGSGAGKALIPLDVVAGEFLTQVPGRAVLTLGRGGQSLDDAERAVRAAIEAAARDRTMLRAEVRREGDTLVLSTFGNAVHASVPEQGHNALWDLAAVASRLELAGGGIASMLRLIAATFDGDHHGMRLGLHYEDALMGSLVVAPTVLRVRDGKVTLQINMRRPRGRTQDEFASALDAAAERIRQESGGAITEVKSSRRVGEPHLAKLDGPLVKTLLEVYREHRGGAEDLKPIAIRGGTYARLFPGAVDFGPALPGEPYTGHAPDESIGLEGLALVNLMVADATYRLALSK